MWALRHSVSDEIVPKPRASNLGESKKKRKNVTFAKKTNCNVSLGKVVK